MGITGLNVCVGIDAGSNSSKVAYFDSDGSAKIIAELDNFNLLALREEAEIFFDEPVFSCVVAIPDTFTVKQSDDIVFTAKKSGFRNIKIITAHDAINSLISNEKILVYDFGASKSDLTVFKGGEIVENEILDICGDNFDEIFSEWLAERFTLNLIDKKILMSKAEEIKITLSHSNFVTWREVKIFREDFERLIHFTVKRSLHTIEKLKRIYKPERFILTGGCANIPAVRNLFRGFEIVENLIAKGAAMEAASLSSSNNSKKINTTSKLRELRGKLIELEELLTRKQKDRLYFLFRQAESVLLTSSNETEILTLLENLIHEISNSK